MQKLDKSKLVMSLSKKQKLVPYLDKAIRKFDKPWEFKYDTKQGDDAWHPSGDCTPTADELYKKITNGSASSFNADGGLNKAFQVGHFWHQLLQHIVLEELEFCEAKAIERKGLRAWDRNGFIDPEDVPIEKLDVIKEAGYTKAQWTPPPYHWATGSGDIAPLVLPKGWEGVVDFKTMGSGQYGRDTTPMPDWCAGKYECQINMYMDFFDLERSLILAINKDSGAFKEWEFVRNQPLIDRIYDKWKFVSECLDDGSFPEETTEEPLPLTGPYEGT